MSLRIKPDDGWCCRHLAWMYAVGPEEVRNAPRSLELAERAVQLLKARSTPYLHTYLTTLGTARYRNGDLDGALDALQRAKGANGQQLPTPTAVLLLAMCNQQMGHPDEARRLYDEAVGWNERLVGFDPVSFQLLQGEAAGLLGLQR